MKKIIRLTESQLIGVIKRVISEESEHVKNLYKSWANKKSGNPEAAMKIMDDVIDNRRSLPKKDFANYASYEELLNDLNKIKQPKPSEDITEFYRGDIKKGDDLVVIAANTWEASCKYGASSKWCTTMKDDPSYWARHNQTGTEFFWIFKNKPQDDPNHKFSYHIKVGKGEPDWCNAVNDCMSTTRLPEKSYPKQHPKYNEIIEKLQEFHNTRDMKNVRQSDDTRTLYAENNEIVENLIYENRNEIGEVISRYGIEKTLLDISIDAIENYIEGDAYDNLPDSISDYEINDYLDELEIFLQRNVETYFDENMLFDISANLSYVIAQFLVTQYNFNDNRYFDEQMQEQGLTIVDVMVQLLENNRYKRHFDEILYEVIGVSMYDTIYELASDFNEKYEKR